MHRPVKQDSGEKLGKEILEHEIIIYKYIMGLGGRWG